MEYEGTEIPEDTAVLWGGSDRLDRGTLVHRMSDGKIGLSWPDPIDTAMGFIDAVRVSSSEAPSWRIELAARPPLPADREPGLLIAYGLVLDTNGDGVADHVVGIDNDAPRQVDFHYHVWVADLATGETAEQTGPPYGFPIEFAHPDEGSPGELSPDGSPVPPTMYFTFLGGTAPPDLDPKTVRFYAWTAVTRDGRLVANDYAPDTGWTSSATL